MQSTDTLGDFELHRTLGAGAFSKVKLGRHKETNQFAAVKIMKGEGATKSFIDLVMNEVKVLQELDHQNLERRDRQETRTPREPQQLLWRVLHSTLVNAGTHIIHHAHMPMRTSEAHHELD